MTHDPLAEVTRLLSDAVSETGDVDAMPPARDEAIARLGDALRDRARAQRRRRVVGAMALAAGVAAVITAGVVTRNHLQQGTTAELGRVHGPGAALTAVRDGRPASLAEDGVVAEGTELRTPPDAEARLDFASGTRVTIGGATRVRLVEQSRKKRFALEAGSFFAKVAKLSADERFVVATSDAEIEVHGTAFRVTVVPSDPSCGGGTTTRLDVSEGVVAVRHAGQETLVAAGERWPTCALRTATAAPPVDPTPATPPRATAPTNATNATNATPATPDIITANNANNGTAPPSPAAARSRLAEQNDLYNDAMRDKTEGRAGAAIVKLDRFLATYPQSALTESATVERMRILAASDRARASSAAREYLRRYPHGFATTEAEALTGNGP